jgi:hypothetical protein
VCYFKTLYKREITTGGTRLEALDLGLPTIPTETQPRLTGVPIAVKIISCLKEMGPDKASGPDGFTVRFLQREWDIIGSEVVRELQNAFVTGQLPNSWMHGHLVLIPKIDYPTTPTHFRPLRVCSIFL